MHKLARYLLALTPIIFTYGGWQLGSWAFEHFHCVDIGKFIEPCFAYGLNIQLFLGITLFWCQLLLYPALILSAVWLFKVIFQKNNA